MNIYTPYTYLIGWTKYNKFYYGRRTAKGCHPSEFWIKYFTSSKYVKEFRLQYGEPDIIEIRKIFPNNPNSCKLWECKFLEKVDAQHNSKFLNQKNSDHKWDTTGISRSLSQKEKEKIRERMTGNSICTGIPKSEHHKKKISESQKGISRTWLIGTRRSEETKQKQSRSLQGVNKGTVTCFDIITKEFIKVPKCVWEENKGIRYFGTTSKVVKQQQQ